MLADDFKTLARTFASDDTQISLFWNEIAAAYTQKGRFYHTLAHLESLLSELDSCKTKIADWSAIVFAICYHDFVYNVLKKDNEEQSALLAADRMSTLSVDQNTIEHCQEMIRATKSHLQHDDEDVNYFTDADLSILGQGWDDFKGYSIQIRKEYAIYPAAIYNAGRARVLKNFLAMKPLFKTEVFRTKYEERARFNLNKAIKEL